MGVCAAVRGMALAIDAAFAESDARVTPAAEAVASMPEWLTKGRLDLWEKRVEQVLSEQHPDGSPLRLLDEVFEFGRFNLYGAFQAKETAEQFRRLIDRLSRHGLVLDEHAVSDW